MANAIRQDTPRGGRAAIESHPWHETALGPMRDWPASLTSAVDLVLSLPMSAAILWSDQLVEVPNEHFLCFAEETVVGMGRLATEAWPDRWPGGAVVWETVLSGRTVSVKVEDEGPQFTFGPLCDETGAVGGIVVVIADGTARAGRAGLQHEHRNTIAWIRSMVKRTALTSPDIDDFLLHLDGRIDVFSRAESAALMSPVGIRLSALVASELLVVGAQENGRLGIEGPEIDIEPRVARTFALALHELATNAVKFGALAGDRGRIDVRWSLEADEGPLVFEWKESDVEETPTIERTGFGFEVVQRTLTYELGATTRIVADPDGLRVTIEAPLDRLTGARASAPG